MTNAYIVEIMSAVDGGGYITHLNKFSLDHMQKWMVPWITLNIVVMWNLVISVTRDSICQMTLILGLFF